MPCSYAVYVPCLAPLLECHSWHTMHYSPSPPYVSGPYLGIIMTHWRWALLLERSEEGRKEAQPICMQKNEEKEEREKKREGEREGGKKRDRRERGRERGCKRHFSVTDGASPAPIFLHPLRFIEIYLGRPPRRTCRNSSLLSTASQE